MTVSTSEPSSVLDLPSAGLADMVDTSFLDELEQTGFVQSSLWRVVVDERTSALMAMAQDNARPQGSAQEPVALGVSSK